MIKYVVGKDKGGKHFDYCRMSKLPFVEVRIFGKMAHISIDNITLPQELNNAIDNNKKIHQLVNFMAEAYKENCKKCECGVYTKGNLYFSIWLDKRYAIEVAEFLFDKHYRIIKEYYSNQEA